MCTVRKSNRAKKPVGFSLYNLTRSDALRSATPKICMPTPALRTDPSPTPPTPAPGAQVTQPPNNLTANNHNLQDESASAGASGSTAESPTPAVIPPHSPADAAPGVNLTELGEDTSVPAKKAHVGKRRGFRPSQAKTFLCVPQHFSPLLVLTALSGASEREWCLANPCGTRTEFKDYFKSLSDKQPQVRGTTANDSSAKVTPQEPKQQAEAKVFSNVIQCAKILTHLPAPSEETEVSLKTRTSLPCTPCSRSMHALPKTSLLIPTPRGSTPKSSQSTHPNSKCVVGVQAISPRPNVPCLRSFSCRSVSCIISQNQRPDHQLCVPTMDEIYYCTIRVFVFPQ